MESIEENLKTALIQLKVSIYNIDLLRNDSIEHCEELDKIKEYTQYAFTTIDKVFEKIRMSELPLCIKCRKVGTSNPTIICSDCQENNH